MHFFLPFLTLTFFFVCFLFLSKNGINIMGEKFIKLQGKPFLGLSVYYCSVYKLHQYPPASIRSVNNMYVVTEQISHSRPPWLSVVFVKVEL